MRREARIVAAAVGLAVLAACATEPPTTTMSPPPLAVVMAPPPVVPMEQAIAECRQAQAGAAPQAPEERLTPLLRKPPDYPPRGLSRELEGYCIMSFDVAADGLVDAGSIVPECSDEMFAEPATLAVERWCFRPSADDGDPPAPRRARVNVVFEIYDDSLAAAPVVPDKEDKPGE